MHRIARLILSIVFCAGILLATGHLFAEAADIQVNAGVGEDGCDLIDAINSANVDAAVGGCTTGDVADVIHLNGIDQYFSSAYSDFEGPTAAPLIASKITIEGDGAIISRTAGAGADFRMLVVAGDGELILHGVTVRGGKLSLTHGIQPMGGGIFSGGRLIVEDSTITKNTHYGLFVSGSVLTLRNSTISDNTAGGIFTNGDTAMVLNSTISGNTTSLVFSNHPGAGIHHLHGKLLVLNSTITDNSGGGIVGTDYGEFGNSIIAGNSASTNPDLHDVYGGRFTSLGHNLIGDRTGASFVDGVKHDQVGTSKDLLDPLLGPLADNGGPALTHALLPRSPALDAGTCVVDDATVSLDQRGRIRPIDAPGLANVSDGCDAGAYENQLVNIVKSVDHDMAQLGDSLLYTLNVRNTFSETLRIESVTDSLLPGPISFSNSGGGTSILPDYLSAGESITTIVSYVVTKTDFLVPNFIGGRLANIATVSAVLDPGGTNLPVSDRDTASVHLAQADLDIYKSASTDSATAGQTITFTLTYTNSGPGVAVDVFITDTLPPGVSFRGIVDAAPAWPNRSQPTAASGSPNTLTWFTPTLAVTSQPNAGEIAYTVVVSPEVRGILTNTVIIDSLTSSKAVTDSKAIDVTTLADLSIAKSGQPAPALAGQMLTYTVAFTNAGPSTALDVFIIDTMPLSVTYGGDVSLFASINQTDTNTPTWHIPILQPGNYTIVFTSTVDAKRTSPIANTVLLTSTTPLVRTDRLIATHVSSVEPLPDENGNTFLPAIRKEND